MLKFQHWLDVKLPKWLNWLITSLLLGSLVSLLGVLASCTGDYALKSSIEGAVKESVSAPSTTRIWNRKPHGGTDEKSSCTPCESAR
jgi:predicted Rdx family selenoprotein